MRTIHNELRSAAWATAGYMVFMLLLHRPWSNALYFGGGWLFSAWILCPIIGAAIRKVR